MSSPLWNEVDQELWVAVRHSEKYLKMTDMKARFVYLIMARNAHIGIWIPEEKGFLISRTKFKDNFLFTEYHWDADPHFGTAKPFKELFLTASRIDAALEYLNELEKQYPFSKSLELMAESIGVSASGKPAGFGPAIVGSNPATPV